MFTSRCCQRAEVAQDGDAAAVHSGQRRRCLPRKAVLTIFSTESLLGLRAVARPAVDDAATWKMNLAMKQVDHCVIEAIKAHRQAYACYVERLAAKDLVGGRPSPDAPTDSAELSSAEAHENNACAELAKIEAILRRPSCLSGVLAVLRYRDEMALDGYDLLEDVNAQMFLDRIRDCLEREARK